MELSRGQNGTAAATLTARWSNQSSWELCPLNINSCVTEAEAGTASGKTLLQGEGCEEKT